MLGLDLAAWNMIMWLALGLAAFAAIAIFLSTRVIITLQDKEAADRADEFARYKVEVGERTAGLEAEAANARLETERLKAQFAWRTISPEATKALEVELAAHPGAVNVEYVAGDPEANNLAIQIANIFGTAKWQVGMMGQTFAGTAIFGLWVPDPPAKDTNVIRAAFTKYGLGFSPAAMPGTGSLMGYGGSVPGGATIFIGSKKPS